MRQIIIIFTIAIAWTAGFAQDSPIKLQNVNLGQMLSNMPGSYPLALDQSVIDKANAGDAESQYRYGIYLRRMDLADKFLQLDTEELGKEAVQWFERAAAQGHAEASIEAGIIYFQRYNASLEMFSERSLNRRKAVNFLRQGGAENDASLMLVLARLAFCFDDNGNLLNQGQETINLCKDALAKGLPVMVDAPLHRSSVYPRDRIDAYMLMATAYEIGSHDLSNYFANIYLAADCGDKLARLYLGECYYAGIGTAEDRAKATEIWDALIAEDSLYSSDVGKVKTKYTDNSNVPKESVFESPEDILRALIVD